MVAGVSSAAAHAQRRLGVLLLLLVLQLLCARLSAAARDIHNDHDLIPGWMGSDYEAPTYTAAGSQQQRHNTRRIEVLNEDARVFLVRGFLTPEECDAIRTGAEPRLVRSGVASVNKTTHEMLTEFADYRTSFNMFYKRQENDVIKAVEARVALWTLLPESHGEGMQVLRYGPGQKYEAHMDYLYNQQYNQNGGPRCATVIAYLTDVEEGGETFFPNLPPAHGQGEVSECAKGHLAIKPRKGDAVLFHSLKPSGQIDAQSMHGSCPVLKGTKWALTKWLHVGQVKY